MRFVCGLLLVFTATISAQDLRRPTTAQDRAQVVSEGWVQARDRLEDQLVAGYFPGGSQRPGSTGVSGYSSWMLLWKWCDLLAGPVSDAKEGSSEGGRVLGDELNAEVLQEWINDEGFSKLLFSTLAPEDDPAAVLKALQAIRLAHPAEWKKYQALAVALAVVYDRPFPAIWPHHQVLPDLVPRKELPVTERFAGWVASNEGKQLFHDLKTLSPEELKFLVDAPIDPIEMEWARKKVRYSRGDFAKSFSSVRYNHARLYAQQYVWAGAPYTLEEIMRRGGICVDQAYYAMIAGKARGLPTLFFTGQGQDGGHAWFGYMKMPGRWEMDCGRYENQNYTIGVALDPQTWKPISDHELEFLTKSFRSTSLFMASQDDLRMAEVLSKHGMDELALKACLSAVSVCPQNPVAWQKAVQAMAKANAPLQERRSLLEKGIEQFAIQRDIRVGFQMDLAKVVREQGDQAAADALENQIMSQNKGRRADLSIDMASAKLETLVKNKEFNAAFEEYRSMLTRLGKGNGGNFFYSVVEPLARTFNGVGDTTKAREVVALARKTLRPESNGILDVDMRALTTELEKKPSS